MSPRPVAYVAALVAILGRGAGTQTLASTSSASDSALIYSGVYASTFYEDIFSPCDVPGIGSGWSLRFKNERDGAFMRYSFGSRGAPALAHFVRVRGRVSAAGRFGLGFQKREIVVDSVLEIRETPQPCATYEDIPQRWPATGLKGNGVSGAAFTDDRLLVATIDRDAVIRVWNNGGRELIHEFPSADPGDLRFVWRIPMAFSHDGKRLAVASTDGVVRIWNPVNGELLRTLQPLDSIEMMGGKRIVMVSDRLELNQSGTLLANSMPGRVAIWSTLNGKHVGTVKTQNFRFVGDTSFVATDSGMVSIYPRLGATPVTRIQTPVKWLNFIERSRDGRWLFVSANDTAYLVPTADPRKAQAIVIPRWAGNSAVAFSADGDILAVAGLDGLYLWETKNGAPLRSFREFPQQWIADGWFTADGRSIVTRSLHDSVLRIAHIDAPSSAAVLATWPSETPLPPEISGRPYGSISGYVRDSTKMGVMAADIWVYDGDRPGSSPIAHTSTNSAGRFLIQSIKVPHVTLRAGKPGFVTTEKHTHLWPWERTIDLELKR